MRTQVTGWHFAGETLRDGQPLPKRGVTLVHDGDVVPCNSGLHLSVNPLDALAYAPGPMVAMVRGTGVCVPHGNPVDKWACSKRTALTNYVSATATLREFARLCALRAARVHVAHACAAVGLDEHAESLRSLPDDAGPDSIMDAVWHARDAAGHARAAAWRAGDAARHAGDTAWDAEWRWQNRLLRRMLKELWHRAALGDGDQTPR